jgi:hypothetical protein
MTGSSDVDRIARRLPAAKGNLVLKNFLVRKGRDGLAQRGGRPLFPSEGY